MRARTLRDVLVGARIASFLDRIADCVSPVVSRWSGATKTRKGSERDDGTESRGLR